MEPINWLAVILGANLAVALGVVWHGPLFRTGRPIFDGAKKGKSYLAIIVVMLIGATMLGHSYARIGAEKLAAKPWLYPMQSGGIALAFIIPALCLVYARAGTDMRYRVIDSLYWLAAYLMIGGTFWALS